jgi:hypothetical protein
MKFTIFVIVLGVLALIGIVLFELTKRAEQQQEPTPPVGARHVDAPGYPPLVHRQPGESKAALDAEPDVWSAIYPPGSLGLHPEQLPAQPGRMTLTDLEDMHTAIGRITRAAAERQQQP